MKSVALLCTVFILQQVECNGEFGFASYYQNNMVLQREPNRAVIWGYGTVGATVNISIIQDVYSTKVIASPDKRGIWSVTLRPYPHGGSTQIQGVQDNYGRLNWILLKNVVFGDVWVCSGQSNMQFTVSMMFNSSAELKAADNYPNVRVMTPALVQSNVALEDFVSIEQPWSVASKESIGGPNDKYFSAVCWLFGRKLYDALKVPIGLIASDWGGTPVETWSSARALEKCGLSENDYIPWNPPSSNPVKENDFVVPKNNSVLWNAMIHPMLKMTIKGAIWYQGEANTHYHADKYACSFPSMINDWRKSWFEKTHGQTEPLFPFGFVQLATDDISDDGGFPKIRWHQTADYGFVPNSHMPNTFMAVAMDLCDDASPFGAIHPRYKEDVGARLALGGLKVAYGMHVQPDGPVIVSAVRHNSGNVEIRYPDNQVILVTDENNFRVCCSFSKCDLYEPEPSADWMAVKIVSHTLQTVTLDAKGCVAKGGLPSFVRYAWQLEPCKYKKCSVYNDLSLPAPPFVAPITQL